MIKRAMSDSTREPLLLDELLSALDEPACVFETGSGKVLDYSKAFTREHAASLFDRPESRAHDLSCNHFSSQLPGELQEILWNVVDLREGRYRFARAQRLPPGSTSAKAESLAQSYLDSWATFEVPGLDWKAQHKHLELIRNHDWSKTDLGPIETWSRTLLSYVGSCLASSFPVLLAWGKSHVMIYNEPYSRSINQKHPRILGMRYKEAWPEVWSHLEKPVALAMEGKGTHAEEAQMFLKRGDKLEETYFMWSMIPVQDDSQNIVAIYIPNFDRTKAVISSRRINFLRDFGLKLSLATDLDGLYSNALAAAKDLLRVDFPAIAFYDCTASSTADQQGSNSSSSGGDQARSRTSKSTPGREESCQYTYHLTASYGWATEDHVHFPAQVVYDSAKPEPTTLAESASFGNYVLKAHMTKSVQIVTPDDTALLAARTPTTTLGDKMNAIVVIPIKTSENSKIRAVAIVGLNPRKALDEDYSTFLEVFAQSLSNGIAGVLLYSEELRRSHALAALNRQKNDELQILLAARTEELKSSETRFETMSSISPAGIFMAANGQVVYANEAWFSISGVPRDVDPSSFMEYVHPDDLEMAKEVWASAHASTAAPCEFRWRVPSGQPERWSVAISKPALDDAGNIMWIAGCILDISQRKQVESLQEKRVLEAEEHKRAQDAFIDMTSHELRNPLGAIYLAADHAAELLELVQQNSPSSMQRDLSECSSDLKVIAHCTQHMRSLIDDQLTLSKLDNNFLVITEVPAKPLETFQDALSLFGGEMRSKDIDCTFDIGGGFARHDINYIRTDPSRLTQILINLLTNAIKFTAKSDTRRIKVSVDASMQRPALKGFIAPLLAASNSSKPRHPSRSSSASADAEEIFLYVEVNDTGPGLTENEIQLLFKRFSQANSKTHISYGGSGLGLYICAVLTEKLGGAISVQSVAGQGSTFAFFVRTTKCAQSPSPRLAQLDITQIQPIENENGAKRQMAILVTEDNIVNQKLLVKQLVRKDYVVYTANNGQEALDFLSQSSLAKEDGPIIDCCLMDIEMPVMDGLAAVRQIRKYEEEGTYRFHLPVIGVSANARMEQQQGMIIAGMDLTVSKPFNMSKLLGILESLYHGQPLSVQSIDMTSAKIT